MAPICAGSTTYLHLQPRLLPGPDFAHRVDERACSGVEIQLDVHLHASVSGSTPGHMHEKGKPRDAPHPSTKHLTSSPSLTNGLWSVSSVGLTRPSAIGEPVRRSEPAWSVVPCDRRTINSGWRISRVSARDAVWKEVRGEDERW